MIKNLIFDLDGTLIDSSHDIVRTLKLAYEKALGLKNLELTGFPPGASLGELITVLTPNLSKTDQERVIEIFKQIYDSGSFPQTRLFPGVYEMLLELKGLNFNLFIATNKRLAPTRMILKKLNIELFKDIATFDLIPGSPLSKPEFLKHLLTKWEMDINQTIMIGDTVQDMVAGRYNGLKTVAVFSGYEDPEVLAKSSPDYKLDHIADLSNLVKLWSQG